MRAFPLVSGGGGPSLAVVLTAVVSLVAEHGLSSCGDWPTCSVASGVLPEQGSNLCPVHGQANSQPLDCQGSPSIFSLNQRIHLFICRAGLTGQIWQAPTRGHRESNGTKAKKPHRASRYFSGVLMSSPATQLSLFEWWSWKFYLHCFHLRLEIWRGSSAFPRQDLGVWARGPGKHNWLGFC